MMDGMLEHMARRLTLYRVARLPVIAALLGAMACSAQEHLPAPQAPAERQQLFDELQPVALANCEFARFGEPHDGGYLMCANLLAEVRSGYSYGIAGYDGWGCDISRRHDVNVHQYDCFDLTRPSCPGGRTVFHEECVAGRTFTDDDGRRFDTIAQQFARNGDTDARVVMKIDVEGSEWASFLAAPEELLERIDQLAVEFHGVDGERYLEVVRRLKRFFVVAHRHFNNYACRQDLAPFPAEAYEVLFVNRRIAEVDPAGRVQLPHPLDTPTAPDRPDCQTLSR
jgi:hypothetical protein